MTDSVKSITITGGAIHDYTGESTSKKRGRKTKSNKDRTSGGETPEDLQSTNTSNGSKAVTVYNASKAVNTVNTVNASNMSNMSNAYNASKESNSLTASNTYNASKASNSLTVSKMPNAPTNSSTSVAPVINLDGGTKIVDNGVKQFKVELKRKSTTHKVKLNPKIEKPKKKHNAKKSRKISLGISSLHKRVTRANRLQNKISNMKIDKLKELLIHKKLIKATSKAPESVLRQIASDSHLVAKNVL